MIGLKRRRDGDGKRDGMAEHRTAGHDVPSSCPTEILRRLVSCVHKNPNRNYCAIQVEKQKRLTG